MDLLFLEPVGGAAGDMFLAAALATLGVPFRLEVRRAEANGIAGNHVDVVPEGPQPHERGLAEILELVRRSGLAPRAKEAALALFDRIGRAEARIHGIALDAVHF